MKGISGKATGKKNEKQNKSGSYRYRCVGSDRHIIRVNDMATASGKDGGWCAVSKHKINVVVISWSHGLDARARFHISAICITLYGEYIHTGKWLWLLYWVGTIYPSSHRWKRSARVLCASVNLYSRHGTCARMSIIIGVHVHAFLCVYSVHSFNLYQTNLRAAENTAGTMHTNLNVSLFNIRW